MRLEELIAALPGCRVRGRRDAEITGITLDSRTVRPGNLFAALPGRRGDGHDHAAEARGRGAAAILAQREVPNGGRMTVVLVEDSRAALAVLADRFWAAPSRELEVIGVTGTNGKTTVCYLTRDLLRAAGRRPALIGTIEYLVGARSIPAERTTPEAPMLQALMREAVLGGCDSLVMEVSSHALAQHRVDCVLFRVAVFTNLGGDHLDFHGGREEYLAAKASLFRSPSLAGAIVNADDGFAAAIADGIAAPVLTYGIAAAASLRATSIERTPRGSRFTIERGDERAAVDLPLLGLHNVMNALAAAGAAAAAGMGLPEAAAALSSARPVPGRLEEVAVGAAPFRVFIDYAHTAEALENALLAVRGVCRGRLIAVFGCGGDRDRSKRLPMGRVAARCADEAIITSDNPRGEDPAAIIEEIARGFAGTGGRADAIPDRREAIAAAIGRAGPGDVVLVAGKGHESTQEFANTVVPFSDRDVVRDLAARRGGASDGSDTGH
ncbi:MAG: UDP-N-acetylmuramoyl-L-alanyl-D-glutamate--2,6-diaminopimelate ligase [bacterium]|nr:UDP-N-acetylmuramoyl-L-alanyl-D-glutamate--2,6-diaminopimelate ligase [bacterium]